MSKRGSMQLLLLFSRSSAKLGWGLGAAIGFLVLVASFPAGDGFHLMGGTGLAQVLRQSAWEQALAGLPEQEPWPWEDTTTGTTTKVPQLSGLSAAITRDPSPAADEDLLAQTAQPAGGEAHASRTKLGDVEVGDRITVTGADGSSRVYKVTGRKVVDPHLEATDGAPSGPSDAEVALVTCSPLDPFVANSLRLIIQAIKVDPPVAPTPSVEQKL
jgi:hypothetical protein